MWQRFNVFACGSSTSSSGGGARGGHVMEFQVPHACTNLGNPPLHCRRQLETAPRGCKASGTACAGSAQTGCGTAAAPAAARPAAAAALLSAAGWALVRCRDLHCLTSFWCRRPGPWTACRVARCGRRFWRAARWLCTEPFASLIACETHDCAAGAASRAGCQWRCAERRRQRAGAAI